MTTRSVGEVLRAKREAQKISLAQMAKQTKINQAYLIALEKNNWQALPDLAFVKGYIIAYAQLLEFDPEPLLALLRRDYPRQNVDQSRWLNFFQVKRRHWRLPNFVSLSVLTILLVTGVYVLYQWWGINRAPKLIIYTPKDQAQVSLPVWVRGTTQPNVSLSVNGQPVALNADGSFETQVSFPTEGLAVIIVSAKDPRGRQTEEIKHVQVTLGN